MGAASEQGEQGVEVHPEQAKQIKAAFYAGGLSAFIEVTEAANRPVGTEVQALDRLWAELGGEDRQR